MPPLKTPNIATAPAITPPKAPATDNSLKSILPQSFIFTSPVARARTISVADCEPVLPPLPINKVRKKTNTVFAEMVSSKKESAAPEKTFMKTNSTSHTIRRLYNRNAGASFRSSMGPSSGITLMAPIL